MSIISLQYLGTLLLAGIVGSLLTWWISRARQQAGSERLHSKIRRLIDANLIGVYIADFSGTIYESNDAFLNMVGYTREDLYAGRMSWAGMTPPEYLEVDEKALEQQRKTGLCIPFEKEYYRKDGSRIPVLFGCTVFDKKLNRSIGFVVDLTEQKRMEEALRISESRFRRFAEANLIGVAESTLDGTYVKANDSFLAMLGYTRADLNAGRINWRQITPLEYSQIDQQVDSDLETKGVCQPFEKEYYRKDGSRVPAFVSLVNVDQGDRRDIGFFVDLSQQKQAEAALRKSEAKFRRFEEANLIGVTESNIDCTYLEANDAFLNMLGYTREDLKAGRLNWRNLTPPEYEQLDRQMTAELEAEGICYPFEKEYYRKDGSRVPILVGLVNVEQDERKDISFVVDLSQQKRVEEALRKSEAKFRRFVEANLIGVTENRPDGTYVEANDAFLKMVGYTREDLYAGRLNWREMTPPGYEQITQQVDVQMSTEGICRPFEKEYYRKDGSRVPTLVGLVCVEQDEKREIGFVVDLSEQKRAEEALRKSEAKFRRFVDANLIGVTECGADGVFVEANDAFLNMLGYTREDLKAGRLNWRKLTPPEYQQLDQQISADLRTKGICRMFEKDQYHRDGSRVPVLMSLVDVGRDGKEILGFKLDLTDRKQAEMASVLEERNRIARDIHDTLAQSFTSILVHLEVASRKLLTDITMTQSCLRTSYELAQTGLAEARRSVAALRPQSLEQKDLYKALYEIAKSMFAHTITNLVCTCDGEHYLLQPEVEENLLRIGQEALMNAAKYAEASEIQLNVRYEPTECMLQIKDNGKGFSWSDQNARRASGEGGFGILGMQERADRIGARLSIQSVPGEGTTIQVLVDRGA